MWEGPEGEEQLSPPPPGGGCGMCPEVPARSGCVGRWNQPESSAGPY